MGTLIVVSMVGGGLSLVARGFGGLAIAEATSRSRTRRQAERQRQLNMLAAQLQAERDTLRELRAVPVWDGFASVVSVGKGM